MQQKQHTLAKEVTFSGKGLHTGVEVTMTVCPAPVNHGVKIQRTDMPGQPVIDAVADNVTSTERGTTLSQHGARVSTIEHLMATLMGLGIDNALIKIDAPEAPILDGSARLYVEAFTEAGLTEQDEKRFVYEIHEKFVYRDEQNDKEIVFLPDEDFSIDLMIDYNSQVVGNQYARLNGIDEFATQIAPCRTFVFFHELEPLFRHNLIKGGDMENAIVIVEKPVPQDEIDRVAMLFNKPHVARIPSGYLNHLELRFPNEIARHKLLDLMGDLALIGFPIKGKIIATKPGHQINTEVARTLRKLAKKEAMRPVAPRYNPNDEPLFDINGVRRMLPHRPPFLLVDKIIQRTADAVVGIKNVTMNEPFFVGHFPDEPVMPGVLVIEAMAQVGGILALSAVEDPENYSTYFIRIDKVRFKRKIVPGDTLIFKLELLEPIRRGIVNMLGQAFVGDSLVTEGELMAQIVRNK
ncbi:MAG: bifunctional UDP-3-O-[3-hydroxymyristoyl] N-acetylglucosamine deacetylase/3-hydroxyacyl-ACP dehydratase [Prevotellaceae bacterium]|jgi:UDP-3-O-[3-hydroxymyristoyl] N-acetylglucosamine deacetylase/3-hydroxyacyl-[acyl-carrier-protein] dehydratase|nr:bifunctional UDP-3-O-[3-hydroxymyristoyl] N-acetylglucosamine deacetylase/3-hydroxyacyl-ACP dehydratase [Prevotellaceae bacterium]